MSLLIYFVFIHASLLVPGYVIVCRLGWLKDEPLAQTALSYAVTIPIFASIAVFYYSIGLNLLILRLAIAAFLLWASYEFIKKRYYSQIKLGFSFIVFLLFTLSSLIYITLPFSGAKTFVPDPTPQANRNYEAFNVKVLNVAHTQANDNSVPYRQAQFFSNRLNINTEPFIKEWGVNFFYRTPLMGAVTSFYFDALGEKVPSEYIWSDQASDPGKTYQKFQIIAQILNGLIILPAFLLIRKLFDIKVANMSVLMMSLSAYFLYDSFFSWPKSMVAFFIICSWYVLVSKRSPLGAGILSGLAYLTHDLAALYIAGSVIYIAFSRKWIDVGKFILGAVIFASPWIIISRLIYHQTSLFIYYPFSLHDIPSDPHAAVAEFFRTPIWTILGIKIESLYYLVAPYQLISEHGKILNQLWAVSIYSIPGAVGLGLFLFSYANLAVRFKKDYRYIISFIFIPILACVTVIGWPKGLGALHFAEALIPLLIAYGIHLILKNKWNILFLIVLLISFTQFAILALYGYNFDISTWLNTRSVVAASTLAVLVAIQFIWILKTYYSPENR